jgi:hypothetical protein
MNLQYEISNWWKLILKNPVRKAECGKHRNNNVVVDFHLDFLKQGTDSQYWNYR